MVSVVFVSSAHSDFTFGAAGSSGLRRGLRHQSEFELLAAADQKFESPLQRYTRLLTEMNEFLADLDSVAKVGLLCLRLCEVLAELLCRQACSSSSRIPPWTSWRATSAPWSPICRRCSMTCRAERYLRLRLRTCMCTRRPLPNDALFAGGGRRVHLAAVLSAHRSAAQ